MVRNSKILVAGGSGFIGANLIKEMVTKYGFSIMGPISINEENTDLFVGDGLVRKKSLIADNTFSKIDNEIINISKVALNNSINILQKNRDLLDKLVEILLNFETIDNLISSQIEFNSFELKDSDLFTVVNKKDFFGYKEKDIRFFS